MFVLTDCCDQLAHLVACDHHRCKVSTSTLPNDIQAAWGVLSDSSLTSRHEGPSVGSLSLMIAVNHAPASQFTSLLNALKDGKCLPNGLVSLALAGRRFKGQRDRAWAAVRGNIHLCVYYRPMIDVRDLGIGLTVLPTLAVVEAIRRATSGAVQPGIKWVNDVLVQHRKVCGVLTGTQVRETTIEHVVFGIGVNVAKAPRVAPTPFVPVAGCLCDSPGAEELKWTDVLLPLLEEIDRMFQELVTTGPRRLIEAYHEHSLVIGQRVQVWAEGVTDLGNEHPIAEGVVTDIDDDLALRIEGVPEPVRSGRLALVQDGSG